MLPGGCPIQSQLHSAEIQREATAQTVHGEHTVPITPVSRRLSDEQADVAPFHVPSQNRQLKRRNYLRSSAHDSARTARSIPLSS